MAHAYTPGLKVLHHTKVNKIRRLPIKGKITKQVGDLLKPEDVVAKTNLPGNVQMLKVANVLNIGPADVPDVMLVGEGDKVEKGQMIAETEGLFGFFKSDVKSPIDGTVEAISDVTGQIVMREAPIPVEVDAYMSGTVKEIIPDEGVIVEADAAFIQGIFGIGGESRGTMEILVDNREQELTTDLLNESHKGKIVVGGSFVSLETYKKALSLQIAGIVVGGFNYYDLEEILGYTLGVAITGSEDLVTSLIVTEGFGNIRMGSRTFDLLNKENGKFVSINGATQIRAGVIRPEIVIPLQESEIPETTVYQSDDRGIGEGSLVRIIRAPYFGKMGEVVSLPPELQQMESETMVRVAEVKIDSGILNIPRANLEMVETD
jgi:biotin carboxyl carrier protein